MADKSSTGAVHLTTLDLDVSNIFEQLNSIDQRIRESAELARNTSFTIGPKNDEDQNPLGGLPENTEHAVASTRASIEKLIGKYLSLEKTLIQFRTTESNVSDFKHISSEIQSAISSLSKYSKTLEDGGKLTKENKKDISDLREQLAIFTNEIKTADNALLKSGESLDKQKNKIANLASSYDKLLISLNKSGFDVNFPDFKKIQTEVTTSAESARNLYNTIKDGTSITDAQAKQFSDLGRTLSDIRTRFEELKKTAELTGEGFARIDEKAPDFDKTIKSLQTLERQYRQLLLSMEKDQRYTNEVFGVLPDVAKNTVTEITGLTDEIRKNGEVSSQQAKRINQLGENYRELKNILLTVKEQAERTGKGLRSTTKSLPDLTSFTKSIEQLNLQYKNFQNTLAKSKLDDSVGTPLDSIKQRANTAANSIADLAKQLKNNGPVTKKQVDNFNELSSTLNTLKGELKDAETNAINAGEGFKTLGEKAKNATSGISDLLVKLADKAKWMFAYQVINLIQNAFGQVIDVIRNTEDTVIELRRVLNEYISDTAISDELHNIAYEFGQTFENVSDVAIRFAQTGKTWQETIDATRATMLGLNTAELEVTTATEGLIAVMAQFNIPASELESVIDKINITADNFPVTSEKIVAALQRAGGTASAFNMTLEETIATITALAEKTGRSGENIGTALNSLIIFTSKSSNMKLFSSLSKEMDDVVKEFQSGSGSIIDVWTQLNKEISKLSEQQKDALFNTTAFEEFADQFEAEAAEYAGTIQDIYGTAGAYRRNYLTILLNDIGTVEYALDNMTDAEGYSRKENETAMESLTKQWNQLVDVARQLAVQFGEVGFLDILKWLTEVATLTLKFTKSIGGLNTVFFSLASTLAIVKAQKIGEFFGNAITRVHNLENTLKTLVLNLNFVKTAQDAYNTTLVTTGSIAMATGAALSSVLGPLSLIATALYAGYSYWKQYKDEMAQAAEEAKIARDNLIDVGKEAENSGKDLASAVKALDNAKISGVAEDISSATRALLEFLGYDKDDIPELVSQFGDLDTAIQKLTETEYEQIKADAIRRKEAAEESFQDIGPTGKLKVSDTEYEVNKATKALHELVTAGYDVQESFGGIGEVIIPELQKIPKNIDEARQQLDVLDGMINLLKENMSSEELEGNEIYQAIVNKRDAIKSVVDEVNSADSFIKTLGENVSEYVENVADSIGEGDAALNEFSGSISKLSEEELEALVKKVEELEEAFDGVSSKIDSFQSAYSSMLDIIEEYNETGILTADMLQTILEMEPEYIQMLNMQEGALSLNQEAVNGLISANDDYLKQLAALKIAKEAERIATDMATAAANGLTAAEYLAGYTAATLKNQVYNAAIEMMNGKISAEEFATSLNGIAESAKLSGDWMDIFSTQVVGLAKSLSSLTSIAKKDTIKTYYTPPKRKSSGKSTAETAMEKEKKKVKELISLKEDEIYFMEKKGATAEEIADKYRALQDIVHKQADKYRKMGYNDTSEIIRDLQKQWWEYGEEVAKSYKTASDEAIKLRENELWALEVNESEPEKLVSKYKEMQQIVHETADKYRELGYAENSEYIVNLQKAWREYQKAIEKVVSGIYDKSVEAYQNAIEELEFNYNRLEGFLDYSGMSENLEKQLDYYKKIQQDAEEEYERLIAKGLDINDDAVQTVVKDWRDAYNSIQDINEKMADNIIERYEDFISLADAFDVWDDLDVSKLDYLKKEMSEINRLFEEGSIPLAKYKDLLEDLGKSYLDARIDELEKQQDEIKENTDRLVKSYEAQIDRINQQKDASDKYYDDLIVNLNEQEESNDRINAQLDYYANRQKILRNLEQAQSRSGVEWREKEIEYQEELANLDEDWRRTQEEWNISDQIEALEKLKQEAADRYEESIARIEESIKRAEEKSEAAIESIEEEMEVLKKKIYEAITEELEKAQKKAEEMKKSLSTIGDSIKPSIQELAKLFDELMDKLEDRARNLGDILSNSASKGVRAVGNVIQNVSKTPKTELIASGASTITSFRSPVTALIDTIAKTAQIQQASKDILDKSSSVQKQDTGNKLLDTVKKIANSVLNFPKQIQERMKSETSAKAISNASNSGGKNIASTTNKTSSKSTEQNNNQTINVFANVPQENATGTINSMVNQFSDFLLHPFKR